MMKLEGRTLDRMVPVEGCALPTGYWTFDAVQERLVEAWGALHRLPDREAGWLAGGTMSLWRQVAATYGMNEAERAAYWLDADKGAPRRGGLTCAEVDRMEQALGWLAWVKPASRRIVADGLAALARGDSRIAWGQMVADPTVDGASDRMRMAYGRAISGIARRLNG